MGDMLYRARLVSDKNSLATIVEHKRVITDLLSLVDQMEKDLITLRDERDRHKRAYDHVINATADIVRRIK